MLFMKGSFHDENMIKEEKMKRKYSIIQVHKVLVQYDSIPYAIPQVVVVVSSHEIYF